MAFIDTNLKEVNCKIVYYGAPMAGKFTSLQCIYNLVQKKKEYESTSKLLRGVLERNQTDVLCRFNFLHTQRIKVKNLDFSLKVHLYSLTGAIFYKESLDIVLKGVDGIVFLADSQIARTDNNHYYLSTLKEICVEQGKNLLDIPYIFQANKRDLPKSEIHPISVMKNQFHIKNEPIFESIACQGIGVEETFNEIFKQVFKEIEKVYANS